MEWGTEEGRLRCLELDVELGLSFAPDAVMPPHVFVTPMVAPETVTLELFLAKLIHVGEYKELARTCVEAQAAFQWRCKLADLAKASTHWPHDIAGRVYASADKALTIEINKRKHARVGEEKHLGDLTPVMRDAEQTLARAQALSAKLGARDQRLEVATELIQAMRNAAEAYLPPRDYAPIRDLLAKWDKLKG